jgi:hypothetical protein
VTFVYFAVDFFSIPNLAPSRLGGRFSLASTAADGLEAAFDDRGGGFG